MKLLEKIIKEGGIMKSILRVIVLIISILIFAACSNYSNSNDEESILKLGVTSYALQDAEKGVEIFNRDNDKYQMEIVMFDDITTPNVALNDGDIDMNFYQHNTYLRQYNEEHGTKLLPVKNKGIYKIQIGLYSNSIDKLDELKEGDKILISQDVVNRGNNLKFLEELGLIELNDAEYPGIPDIKSNPLNLDIVDVSQVITHMDSEDVTAVVAMGSGMVRDGRDASGAVAYASSESLEDYQQCLVVREEDAEAEWALDFYEKLTSDEMQEYYTNFYGEDVFYFE